MLYHTNYLNLTGGAFNGYRNGESKGKHGQQSAQAVLI